MNAVAASQAINPRERSAIASERILGIGFFDGTAREAVDYAMGGGLVVAPSGTCFERFMQDEPYRRAILEADLVLPDSGFMVLLWRLFRGRALRRISGLKYLQELLRDRRFHAASVLWVLPNERAREKLLRSREALARSISPDECYIAPIYGRDVDDEALVRRVQSERPHHVVIGIGAGAQEKLGFYLRENAGYRIGIHCIGGALGFVTGDQVAVPDWADRLYLGWMLRLLSEPAVFIPRLARGRVLPRLIMKYGAELPPLRNASM